MIIIGFLNIVSREAMIEASTSATSLVMRLMMSPFFSWEKYPMCSDVILR